MGLVAGACETSVQSDSHNADDRDGDHHRDMVRSPLPSTPVNSAMELLTMVSRVFQPIAWMAATLDVSEYRVLQRFKRLRRAGFEIEIDRGTVRVEATGWERVRVAAEAYYERTYGDE